MTGPPSKGVVSKVVSRQDTLRHLAARGKPPVPTLVKYQQARWNLGSRINVFLALGLPFNYTDVVADVDTWCVIYPAGGWGPDMFTLRLLERFI